MLLDNCLPTFHFNTVHSIAVQSLASRTMAAIKDLETRELSPVAHALFAIRSWPERLCGKEGLKFAGTRPVLTQMLEGGFVLLEEQADRELGFGPIVSGLIGRFWKTPIDGVELPTDAQEFVAFDHPDYAKVVANFYIDEDAIGVRARAESRIQAQSPQARKDFTFYWRVSYPGVTIIQWMWLQAIKRRAEQD
jgi:hypothetical protein